MGRGRNRWKKKNTELFNKRLQFLAIFYKAFISKSVLVTYVMDYTYEYNRKWIPLAVYDEYTTPYSAIGSIAGNLLRYYSKRINNNSNPILNKLSFITSYYSCRHLRTLINLKWREIDAMTPEEMAETVNKIMYEITWEKKRTERF